MAADPYGDPDLVALYDLDNPDGIDHNFYRALANGLDARRIIDLGCGTGLLTRTLVRPGRAVTGIDPSATMLNWAKGQPGAETVIWIHGDASGMAPSGDVDLVICSGNTIMHLDHEELNTALSRIRKALRPGGTLSFESRNPGLRAWEQWTRAATYDERETALGCLREWVEVTDVEGERVTFDAHNVLPKGEHRAYTNVLHFRGPDAYRAALHGAGFGRVEIAGGWSGEQATLAARVLVYQAS